MNILPIANTFPLAEMLSDQTSTFIEYLANEKKAFVLLFDAIYHTVVGSNYFYVPFLFLNY